MLQTQVTEYYEGETKLIGYYTFDDAFSGKRPAVLVAHDWSGCNDFSRKKAEKLAELGYVGFSIDMYGDGKIGDTKEEKTALIQPLLDDRALLARRINSAVEKVKTLDFVDSSRIGAIGFCFGGLCVLDLARSGANVSGVVSFHGLLFPPQHSLFSSIKAKILALHGHDDPMVPVEQVNAFETEMTNAHVDWQLHIYGQTMHAFTNPIANDPDFGTVYNSIADSRSWIAMKNFFLEIFK